MLTTFFMVIMMCTLMSNGPQGSPMLKMFHEVPLYVFKISITCKHTYGCHC